MRETTATPNINIRKGKDVDQSDTSRYTYIRHTQIVQISFLRQNYMGKHAIATSQLFNLQKVNATHTYNN